MPSRPKSVMLMLRMTSVFLVFLLGEDCLHLVLVTSTISNAVKREQKIYQEEDCAINMDLSLQPRIDIQGLNKFELSC